MDSPIFLRFRLGNRSLLVELLGDRHEPVRFKSKDDAILLSNYVTVKRYLRTNMNPLGGGLFYYYNANQILMLVTTYIQGLVVLPNNPTHSKRVQPITSPFVGSTTTLITGRRRTP